MDEPDGAAKAGEQKRSKVLSLEQQRKFEELRERRLQLKNAQDVVSSGKKKKKKRKRGTTGNDEHPGSSSLKTAASEKQRSSIEDQRPTETVKFGSQQRHVFGVTAGERTAAGGGGGGGQLSTAQDMSVSQSSRASRGDGNLDSMTFENPSGMIIPAKTPDVPQKEVAALAKKKRKKLNWGMEIKARWERKGNM